MTLGIYELWNVIKKRPPDFSDSRSIEQQEIEAFAFDIRDSTLEQAAKLIESIYDRPDIAESVRKLINGD